MKYTPATIAKSLVSGVVAFVGAAAAAAHGADLSTLDAGAWLFAIASGATAAGAVFATPNKQAEPAGDVEPAAPPAPIADVAIDAVKQTVQNAADGAAELDRVLEVARAILGAGPLTNTPVPATPDGLTLGEHLADQVIRSVLP